jgi:transcriptional regulator with XRE-family HTH domain
VGKILKELRERAGMSQRDLAEKVGKSQQAIQQYEREKATPKLSTAKAIAEALQVPLDTFYSNHELANLTQNLPVYRALNVENPLGEPDAFELTDMSYLPDGEYFYLSIGEQINNRYDMTLGTRVLVRRQKEIDNDSISVIIYKNAFYIRRVVIHKGDYILLSSEINIKTMIVPIEESTVVGVCIRFEIPLEKGVTY